MRRTAGKESKGATEVREGTEPQTKSAAPRRWEGDRSASIVGPWGQLTEGKRVRGWGERFNQLVSIGVGERRRKGVRKEMQKVFGDPGHH